MGFCCACLACARVSDVACPVSVLCCMQDSRSSSPARSPKGLQTTPAAPEVVKSTDSNHAASTAAKHAQQQLSGAQDPAPTSNGATAATNGATAPPVRAVSVMWQDQQQPNQQEQQLAGSTDSPDSSSPAVNGCDVARPVPSVPPLAPGTGVMRTSTDGSACNSRRASRLSDAGRASSRTSLPSTRSLDTSAEPIGQQQQQLQQPPARPAVSQLPLHLVSGCSSSPTPPSVASQQVRVLRARAQSQKVQRNSGCLPHHPPMLQQTKATALVYNTCHVFHTCFGRVSSLGCEYILWSWGVHAC
jgi:hypothetical protein